MRLVHPRVQCRLCSTRAHRFRNVPAVEFIRTDSTVAPPSPAGRSVGLFPDSVPTVIRSGAREDDECEGPELARGRRSASQRASGPCGLVALANAQTRPVTRSVRRGHCRTHHGTSRPLMTTSGEASSAGVAPSPYSTGGGGTVLEHRYGAYANPRGQVRVMPLARWASSASRTSRFAVSLPALPLVHLLCRRSSPGCPVCSIRRLPRRALLVASGEGDPCWCPG